MFEYSDKSQKLQVMLKTFMEDYIYPTETAYTFQSRTAKSRDTHIPLVSVLKQRAKAAGLWNLFISEQYAEYAELGGLSCLDCAPLAETMGRVNWSSEIFNCSTTDTGNMEVLMKHATREQKEKWLIPLLNGDIHSSCAVAKPGVVANQETNPELSIDKYSDECVLNGNAWFLAGTVRENTKLFIVTCNSGTSGSNNNKKQTYILVPAETLGVEVVQPLSANETDDTLSSHVEVIFGNVRVPVTNILHEENLDFKLSQDRLGRADVHHCMQLIGAAQRSLELACKRASACAINDSELSTDKAVSEDIATSFSEIEMARLLVLKTCQQIDNDGTDESKDMIAACETSVPAMVQKIIDRCMKNNSTEELSKHTLTPIAFNYAQILSQAIVPHHEHLVTLGEHLIEEYAS